MTSNKAISFFIEIEDSLSDSFPSLSLDNSQTKETLVIKEPTEWGIGSISRYPSGASEQWIKEMKKDSARSYRRIVFENA